MDNNILIPILLVIIFLLPRVFFSIRRRVRKRKALKEKERKFNEESTRNQNRDATDELNTMLRVLLADWTANRFKDKVEVISGVESTLHLIYTFEGGNGIEFKTIGDDNLIIHGETTYSVNTYHWGLFLNAIKVMAVELKSGIAKTRGWRQRKSKPKQNNTTTNHDNKDHPKWERYWSLITTIRQRTTNLKKMAKGNSERSGLVNELNSTKRRAKAMKEKYNF